MKKLAVPLLLLLVAAGAAVGWMAMRPSPDVEHGSVAPDLSFATPDGAPLTLASLRGRVVLLDFWASS